MTHPSILSPISRSLTQQQQKLLLVDHKKAGLWLPSGGHVEIDEHPQTTVQREVREELGIEATFLEASAHFSNRHTDRGVDFQTHGCLALVSAPGRLHARIMV